MSQRVLVLDGLRGFLILFMAWNHIWFQEGFLLGWLHFGELGFDLVMGSDALRRVDAPLARDAFEVAEPILAHSTVLGDDELQAVADDLRQNAGRSVVLAGPRQPALVHALVHHINDLLKNVGTTVEYRQNAEPPGDPISRLTEALDRKQIVGRCLGQLLKGIEALFVKGVGKGHPEYYQDLARRLVGEIPGAWLADQQQGAVAGKRGDGDLDAVTVADILRADV